ncbi:hypothetical protein N9W17_06515 [Jannaschia sp.]|nr:hypothetical protein [Jannaschia sp.]
MFTIIHRMSPSLEPPSALTFFGDASSRDDTYMVAGGFAVAGHRIEEIDDHIASLRDEARISREFHCSDYRGGQRQDAYHRLINFGYSLVRQKHAALHVIVRDFKAFDHKAKPGENKDTSSNKMYWQLCVHRLGRFYGRKRAIHVRLDAGNDSQDICQMRNQVCAETYRRWQTRPNCIRSIEAMDSARSGILQMADVMVGGIASNVNGRSKASAKGQLADYILRKSGLSSWQQSTTMDARWLTVWHHRDGGPPTA